MGHSSFKRKEFLELKIVPLYKNFFRFLTARQKGEAPWPAFWRHYYFPHRRFFESYFSLFPLVDRPALKGRVEAVKPAHYGRLRLLLQRKTAERILASTHRRCLSFIQPEEHRPVEAYLLIGFFSPEAFLMRLGEKLVIVFGLERYHDFSRLDIFYAHELAHLLIERKKTAVPQEKRAVWYLLTEGIACWFSSRVLPEHPLTDHLFLSRGRLNWCWQNQALLRKIFTLYRRDEGKIRELEQRGDANLGLPPRVLHFLGYLAVEKQAPQLGDEAIRVIFASPEKLLTFEF